MPSVLIVGAGRGIGREFAERYAAAGWDVHATCRDPAALGEDLTGKATWHPLEVTDARMISELRDRLGDVALDVVVVSAGLMGPRDMRPEAVDRAAWMTVLATNTLAPLAVVGALKPCIMRGQGRKVVALSSRLGSIAGNETGSLYVYRSSKAALNAVWKSLSIDWKADGIICTTLHPGWVRTDMGGPNGEIDPPTSVAGMMAVIDRLTPDQSGHMLNYDGTRIAW